MNNKLNSIKTENIIWLIYIFIFIFAIISNYFEKNYIYTNNQNSKRIYQNINLTILTIALIIYLYFVIIDYEKISQNKYGILKEAASIMFFIAGVIVLYIEYKNQSDEEIGII